MYEISPMLSDMLSSVLKRKKPEELFTALKDKKIVHLISSEDVILMKDKKLSQLS